MKQSYVLRDLQVVDGVRLHGDAVALVPTAGCQLEVNVGVHHIHLRGFDGTFVDDAGRHVEQFFGVEQRFLVLGHARGEEQHSQTVDRGPR